MKWLKEFICASFGCKYVQQPIDSDNPCKSVRICSRCGDVKERSFHLMGAGEYVGESCDQISRCTTPGCKETRPGVLHLKSEPVLSEEEQCLMIVTCTKCGINLGRYKQHDFQNGKCTRCDADEPPPSNDGDDEGNYDWGGYSAYRSMQGIPH